MLQPAHASGGRKPYVSVLVFGQAGNDVIAESAVECGVVLPFPTMEQATRAAIGGKPYVLPF